MNLPPGAIIHDDGETLYIRQDRDESAFLDLQHQSCSIHLAGAALETLAESLHANIKRLDGHTMRRQASIDSLYELARTVGQIGMDLQKKFHAYRSNWKEEGDLSNGNRSNL